MFLIFILLFISCCQSQSNNSLCLNIKLPPPSSCGNLNNIGFPFRLKSDPSNCGDPNYELDCQNNQTIIHFNSKKLFIQSINYHNYTIRVVDPGLINPATNCSFPINSATNLYDDTNIESYVKTKLIHLQYKYNLPIVFISCVDPISYSSSSFIDISFCRGTQNTSDRFLNPSRTYEYIRVLNYTTQIWELLETCGVEEVAFSSANGPLTMEKNSSLAHIYQGLAYGFELSWYQVKCEKCDGYCTLQDNNKVTGKHCPPDADAQNSFYRSPGYCLIEVYTGTALIYWSLVIGAKFFIGLVCLTVLVVHIWRRRHLSGDETIEDFLQVQTNILPIKYSYPDIKKMTNKFNHKLGEGGYGIVYR